MLTDFPLASPLSSASLSSFSTSSSSTSSLPRTQTHQDQHSHSYSSYTSSPLATFFPSPPSVSSFFFFPDVEIELNSNGIGSKAGGGGVRDESDAFGLGGFFERSVGGGGADGRGFGWVGGWDEEESENESDEGELEEQQGEQGGVGHRPGDGGTNSKNLWIVQTEEVHSPVIETTFGFDVLASEGEKDGREETSQEDTLSPSTTSSLLDFLPSPLGSYQYVEHEDTLLRSFSSPDLVLVAHTTMTVQEKKAAGERVARGEGAGGGAGWREWIGV